MDLTNEFQDECLILFIENIKKSDVVKCKKGAAKSKNEVSKKSTQEMTSYILSDEEDNDTLEHNVVMNKIPKVFTSLETWIKKTNLRCWYCSLNFDTVPVFLPINIYKKNNKILQDVHGNFCSFNCTQSYINVYFCNKDTFIYNNNLIKLYKTFYKKNIASIDISPSKYDLALYGGYLTESEYKNKISNLINHDYT